MHACITLIIMKICNIIILIAELLSQIAKTFNTEIPRHSYKSVKQKTNTTYNPVHFACSIISTSTDEPFCTGSIISPHFVVSSCLMCLSSYDRPVPSEDIKIAVPLIAENRSFAISSVIYTVQHVHLHHGCMFNGEYNLKNDIGIVQTSEEIELDKFTIPAVILHPYFQFDFNEELMISSLQTRNTGVTTLDEAVWRINVKILPPNICSSILNRTYYDPDTVYCTNYHHTGSTDKGCNADYGAPLSSEDILVGILIHKFACGFTESAASFVNITLHSEWLTDTVQKLSNGNESV